MRRKLIFIFFILPFLARGQKNFQDLITRFEKSERTQTPTYQEAIEWWKKMDAASPMVKMVEMGPTDAGYPLHLVLVSSSKDFDIASIKKKKKCIILINNGIHPGEPDGIDASMLLVRGLVPPFNAKALPRVKRPVGEKRVLPEDVVLAIIPVYNIGGALNRSPFYRVDQDGPEEFGSRGNSQNLDLNRDFIKGDTKEALTFAKIFRYLDPDIFIDNHVSNGADYQHVMTLLTTQHNRLGGKLGEYLNGTFEPELYALMREKGFDLVPYVNHFGDTPDKGWSQYWDSPRYSSGYAALWSTFAFVPETHMLKPYWQRVQATEALMESFISFAAKNRQQIIQLREEARKAQQAATDLPLAWKWDRTKSTEILFKGYEAGRKPSEVSGLPRLYYDRSKPFEKRVPFYNVYLDTLRVEKPRAYIIPQGWWKVIDRLQANNIPMRRLTRDTTVEVEAYRIESYQPQNRLFEWHRMNTNVQVSRTMKKINFRKGDYYIPVTGPASRFLVEVLEPQGEDSYFAWNFFDPILTPKEGFSGYVFEETAARYLQEHPELKARLEQRRQSDTTFAKTAQAQLNFVFQNSPYAEPAHMQYPVYRVMKP
jgi:hypothetical protein